MKKMTEDSLKEAFAGESMAHMKYLIYSEIAEKENLPNIARLFRAISYAEKIHAENHARNLGLIKKTPENLKAGLEGETYEIDEMYPVFKMIAEFQNEKKAELSNHYALEAEKIHAEMYKNAIEIAQENKDMEIDKIYICPVCGYTHEGESPEKCPICGVSSDKFREF